MIQPSSRTLRPPTRHSHFRQRARLEDRRCRLLIGAPCPTLCPNGGIRFDTPFGKIGVAICYDIRFPELGMLARREGCVMLVYVNNAATENVHTTYGQCRP